MPLTVDDLADHLQSPPPAEGSQQRREMQRALDAAVQEITRATGMLDDRTVTVSVTGAGGLLLPYMRLTAIGAVTDAGGFAITPTSSDPRAGFVDVGPSFSAGGSWQVECTGAPWPAALTTAALDWAAHLYDTQRMRAEPVDSDEPVPSYALPNRVEELLRPYRSPGFA